MIVSEKSWPEEIAPFSIDAVTSGLNTCHVKTSWRSDYQTNFFQRIDS